MSRVLCVCVCWPDCDQHCVWQLASPLDSPHLHIAPAAWEFQLDKSPREKFSHRSRSDQLRGEGWGGEGRQLLIPSACQIKCEFTKRNAAAGGGGRREEQKQSLSTHWHPYAAYVSAALEGIEGAEGHHLMSAFNFIQICYSFSQNWRGVLATFTASAVDTLGSASASIAVEAIISSFFFRNDYWEAAFFTPPNRIICA